MKSLELYERVRAVPPEALRPIMAGRLKGKSDINPMWRIKKLTEVFGPVGIGWKPEITRKWLEPGNGGEVAAFVDMNLYINVDGVWSDPIPGTGGSMFIEAERSGLHTSDEAYKMAYTDAISVCCKLLGFGADVYWGTDRTKYGKDTAQPSIPAVKNETICESCGKAIQAVGKNGKELYSVKDIVENSRRAYGKALCWNCMVAAKAEKEAEKESK